MKAQDVRYYFSCMNAFVDGHIYKGFASDDEAIRYAANYEATMYRIEPDGRRVCIWEPGKEEAV